MGAIIRCRRSLAMSLWNAVAWMMFAALGAYGELKQSFLMDSPFTTHDHRGSRMVPYWDSGGSTVIKQSFLRLTPDKPNQTGYLWSRQKLDTPFFSLTWKFRISGSEQGRYGEKLTLIIGNTKFRTGPFWGGLSDEFVGLAIVVDTNRMKQYQDPEQEGGSGGSKGGGVRSHKDIRMVLNNGTRRVEDLEANSLGCNSNIRYFEGRDDFNVLQASRIRLKMDDTSIGLDIDARNAGRWRRCITLPLNRNDMPADWARRSYMGMVGTTSEYFNNHDVLGLKVYTTPLEAWEGYEDEEEGDELDALVHHMEHELFSIHDNLQGAIDKLEEAEEIAEDRLLQLEESMNRNVMKALNRRVSALEEDVQRSVKHSVNRRIGQVYDEINERVEEKLTVQVGKMSSSWQRPFYLLLLVMAVVLAVCFAKFRELRKQHIL